MYAIVEIAGQQFKVRKNEKIFVHRLEEEEGAKVSFDNVMLIDNDGKVNVGSPSISGASVSATVLEHMKGDKVIVFKKKRRKGYKVKNGHRQYLTHVEITGIAEKGATPKKADEKPAAKKKEAAPKAKAEAKEATPKKVKTETKEAKKETAPTVKPEAKEAAVKKPAPKKAAAKGDDLKKIEGIGPKIAEVLNEAGIKSFGDLSKSSTEKLKEILASAGSRYASKNPSTWPQQAQLAADGKWEELKELQDKLHGGLEK